MTSVRARRWVAVALIAATPLGCRETPATTGGPTTLRQAGFRVLYMWPMFVGQEKGFFRDEGLDFEYVEVDSGLLGVAAVVSGDAHIADMGVNDVANLHRQGRELVLVYQLVRRMTMDLIFGRKVADRLGLSRDMPLSERYRALKGLTIGITRPGAVTDVFVRYYLTRAGLRPDRDAILLPVGGATPLATALRTGQIDAYLLSPPIPDDLGEVIVKSSAGDVPELDSLPFVNLAVSRTYAERYPDVIRAYIRTVRRAITWAEDNRPEALDIVRRHFPDVDARVLERAWEDLLPAMSSDGRFTEEGVRRYLQIMVDMGHLAEMPPTREGILWTNRFVR